MIEGRIKKTLTAHRRMRFLDDWTKMSNVSDAKDIDYSIPQIHLEFLLCDVDILKDLHKDGGRARLFERLTAEEQDIYLNAIDEQGNRYRDLERTDVSTALERELKTLEHVVKRQQKRAERKNKKLSKWA